MLSGSLEPAVLQVGSRTRVVLCGRRPRYYWFVYIFSNSYLMIYKIIYFGFFFLYLVVLENKKLIKEKLPFHFRYLA